MRFGWSFPMGGGQRGYIGWGGGRGGGGAGLLVLLIIALLVYVFTHI
jgi:hypothetical protein